MSARPNASVGAESDDAVRTVTQYTFKILVVGDAGAGKTSSIKRFVDDVFSGHSKTTIGVDFAVKVIEWDDDTIVRLQLWDIAGQERYGCMTRVYYKEALGALLVYDVTNPDSFDGVEKWKRDLDDKVTLPTVFGGGGPVPAVLLANKCDLAAGTNHLPPRQSTRQLDRFCADHGFLAWFPTSAKENSNLEEAVRCLVDRLLELVQQSTEEGKGAGGGSRGAPSSDESGRVDLSAAPAHGSYFSRCC